MCKQVVQGIYIAAIRMVEKLLITYWLLVIIKWSHVDVMRPSLSLGVQESDGLGEELLLSLSVLPSGYGSAYQMAAEWKDSYWGGSSPWWFWQLCFCCFWGRCPACSEGRADPEMRSAKRTTLCRTLQSWLELFPYHIEMHWVNTLSMVPE